MEPQHLQYLILEYLSKLDHKQHHPINSILKIWDSDIESLKIILREMNGKSINVNRWQELGINGKNLSNTSVRAGLTKNWAVYFAALSFVDFDKMAHSPEPKEKPKKKIDKTVRTSVIGGILKHKEWIIFILGSILAIVLTYVQICYSNK